MKQDTLSQHNLEPAWKWSGSPSNLIGAAIHDGPHLRREVAEHIALSKAERQREEDPYTGQMAQVLPRHVVASQSRFEVDFNRPRDKAIYRVPEDAWGLEVWKDSLPETLVHRSLALYDAFYAEAEAELRQAEAEFGRFVVFDLHSYNHRRDGRNAAPADPEGNPEVNVGTRSLTNPKFRPLVDRFLADLRAFDFGGRRLDVRENVKFGGGEFSAWIHRGFPETGCALAIEWKKFWMDEWSGEADPQQLERICRALESTLPGMKKELARL